MGKINQLSTEISNLIAAGEVVDRPSSVIKELMENSIDAFSTQITVEIRNGGISYMRVSDNGCGILPEDLPVSVRRHATSKISSAKDLDSIHTLGFRGEALAAISAVCSLRILTKSSERDTGALLESVPDYPVNVSEVGCGQGTTVIAEELFANVPARRKFLKRDITESAAVCSVAEKIALSHPEIAVTMISDKATRFSTSGDGDLRNTLYALYGRDFAAKLIKVDSESDGIGVTGYIGRSDNSHGNRNYENFFINGRFIKTKTGAAATEQAYCSYMAEDRFPVAFIMLTIPPEIVDVNVHPSKLEVKFSDERKIFEAVYYGVRNALVNDTAKADFAMPGDKKPFGGNTARSAAEQRQGTYYPPDIHKTVAHYPKGSMPFAPSTAFIPIGETHNPEKLQEKIDINVLSKIPESSEGNTEAHGGIAPEYKTSRPYTDANINSGSGFHSRAGEGFTYTKSDADNSDNIITSNANSVFDDNYRIIGIAFNTYIIVETGSKLLFIDKHAAHERIIFEQLKAERRNLSDAHSVLLIPIHIVMSPEEFASVCEYGDEIKKTGFEFETDAETRTVTLGEIPSSLSTDEAGDLFVTMAHSLACGTGTPATEKRLKYEKALYSMSCKAAMKGGRNDRDENIEWICVKLREIPDIKVCPHGRPVVTELEKRYMDRQFDRLK